MFRQADGKTAIGLASLVDGSGNAIFVHHKNGEKAIVLSSAIGETPPGVDIYDAVSNLLWTAP